MIRGEQVPLFALVALFAFAAAGGIGYLSGHATTPSEEAASRVREASHREAFRSARSKARRVARERAYAEGFARGKERGARAGARDAAADVRSRLKAARSLRPDPVELPRGEPGSGLAPQQPSLPFPPRREQPDAQEPSTRATEEPAPSPDPPGRTGPPQQESAPATTGGTTAS